MPHLINENQTCGVKGRNIHDNLMVVRDVIDYVNLNNKAAAIINIDQEKAFDRIEWRYMYATMEAMGVPGGLIEWIQTIYSNPLSTINVNNYFTEPIRVTRGIRQGCPMSPSLYAICAEGLANMIRNNKRIKGLELPKQDIVKIIQHADDMSIFITQDSDFKNLEYFFTHTAKDLVLKLMPKKPEDCGWENGKIGKRNQEISNGRTIN